MSDSISTFTTRLYTDWLPSFCNTPHRNYSTVGFRENSISKLSEFDAYWFLRAIDSGLIKELDGFFTAPRSKAKEQIFWQGLKSVTPRPVTLWVEPVITLGTLARLNEQFGWPVICLGAQSKKWAFDLVCYDHASDHEYVACEVKKSSEEIAMLLKFMHLYCEKDLVYQKIIKGKELNAYKKVLGVRRS